MFISHVTDDKNIFVRYKSIYNSITSQCDVTIYRKIVASNIPCIVTGNLKNTSSPKFFMLIFQ